MLAKALLGARRQLLSVSLALENQIRGILKTFGRIVPKGGGGLFEKNVRAPSWHDAHQDRPLVGPRP
jgi:transposase